MNIIEAEATAARAAATGAHAAPDPASGTGPQPVQPSLPRPTVGRNSRVPKWFVTVMHATHSVVSHLAPVIMSPEVDQLIEAALRADGLGVEAQVFHGAIDMINGAADRKAAGQPPPVPGTAERPAFQPAPDAPQDGT